MPPGPGAITGMMTCRRISSLVRNANLNENADGLKCFICAGLPSGVYDNIYGISVEIHIFRVPSLTQFSRADDLDDSPVTWHITEPVDVGEYQNEWLGSVINIY